MRKKLYILYTDKLKQPDYGYFYPVLFQIKKFLKYIFLLNHWGYGLPFPSWLFDIRKWCRKKDFFGYWTYYRRKENEKSTDK